MKHGSTWNVLPSHVLPAALLLALLAGCSTGTTEAARPGPSSGATASPSPAAPASPPPSLPRTADDLPGLPTFQDPSTFTPFTGDAADEFGADAVMTAYRGATEFLLRTTFDDEAAVLDVPPVRLTDTVRRAMTPRAAALWDEAVADVRDLTGPAGSAQQSFENVFALASWGYLQAAAEHVPGAVPAEPRLRDIGFGGGTTGVVTDGGPLALDMRFPLKGQFLLVDPQGVRWRMEVRKDVALNLVPTGDGRWLIDGWKVDRVVEIPVRDDPAS